jgi:hypothetical protein
MPLMRFGFSAKLFEPVLGFVEFLFGEFLAFTHLSRFQWFCLVLYASPE